MASEKKKYNKGGQISRYELINMQEISSSNFIKKSFGQVGYLGFCEKVKEVGYHCMLTSLFSTNFKRKKTTIAWMDFLVPVEVIASTTGIPN